MSLESKTPCRAAQLAVSRSPHTVDALSAIALLCTDHLQACSASSLPLHANQNAKLL